ncbi:MAG: hypothetical protein HYY06_02355 [Deltaproteobacteria bacterium]|nr:hypothetical protein [Deltaproteobacteria bacterium]
MGRASTLAAVLLVGACELPPTISPDAGIDGAGPAGECGAAPTALDLLFLIDNSNSMAQEQASLADCFGGFGFGALVDPPDMDQDDKFDREPVGDLHVGFISPDMGTGGYEVPTCDDPVDGDDGLLLHAPSPTLSGCKAEYPRFLSWSAGDETSVLRRDFACLATLGTGGCAFEQHLRAVSRALVDHAGGPNAGFLRDDSFLAVVIQSDEDDASVRKDVEAERIFDPDDDELGPLNLRPFRNPDLLVSPAEIAEGLLALRPCPERLFVGAIVGTPIESQCTLYPSPDLDCLLAEPAMRERIDYSAFGQGERLVPVCDVPGLGEAFPARRVLELLRELQSAGANVAVVSICESDPWLVFAMMAEHFASLAGGER